MAQTIGSEEYCTFICFDGPDFHNGESKPITVGTGETPRISLLWWAGRDSEGKEVKGPGVEMVAHDRFEGNLGAWYY